MFEEYLLATVIAPERFESTQGEIQELAMEESNYELFKNILIKKIQNQPNEDLYVDFLSWLFVQNQDFKQALIQFKALDRRKGEGEIRLIQLASVAEEYNEYDIAEEVYDYIITKGESSNFYYRARQGILDVRYYKITRSADADLVEIESLEKDLEEFVDRNVFRFEGSGESVLRLAEIEAVYLNNPSEGIETLRSFLTRYGRRINENLEAEIKLALGDYFILMDDVWEATLYYGQVEKMFKDHPLGHEAKFRNARLSFYRGEFDWAQAQLKVLKGSTSELIANDALNLSILIQDNYGLDTTEKPLFLFSRADFLAFKGNYSKANQTFDSLLNNYPDHTLTDEIYFSKAKMFSRKAEYDTALYFYNKVYTEHANDILADDALAAAADTKLHKLDDKDGAAKVFGKILFEYPGSVFIPEAREKYRQLESNQDLDKNESELSKEEKFFQNMN